MHDWRSSETVICTSAAKAGKLISLTAGLKACSTLALQADANHRLLANLDGIEQQDQTRFAQTE